MTSTSQKKIEEIKTKTDTINLIDEITKPLSTLILAEVKLANYIKIMKAGGIK